MSSITSMPPNKGLIKINIMTNTNLSRNDVFKTYPRDALRPVFRLGGSRPGECKFTYPAMRTKYIDVA